MAILVFLSIIKYLFFFVCMGGVGALFVYFFFDAGNKKLKKFGIRFAIAGFLAVILISLIEMYLI